ncbi:ribosomal-protein-alanine N-acetyltransferase [Clostridium cavendishii DSM 21758]|uniref:Ribosomal-protein-alanine N-acetyltransferase n=1 Tax=Clostridium cavendishii DSM 21758 TaxID=1121302 RepID=A0A1M6V6X7_9CLOT|nr:GNAT family N-acetyltransferase [Clostridium cavendishii]SHK77213.1 ribosomal-protein-alanine N-acetyltransferase [Clostridium cavendishii DSM 21758]
MLNHKGTVIIETERLILRPFKQNDAEAMFKNWCNDIEVCKFLSWGPHKDIYDTRDILKEWTEGYLENNSYNWAITLKDKNEPIGSIGAFNVCETNERCEIGYCIGKSFWGKGIMTEALKALLNFFFYEVGIHRIQLRHDVKNPGSGKVMQKVGMIYEATLNEFTKRRDGSFGNLDLYYITKDIYFKNLNRA